MKKAILVLFSFIWLALTGCSMAGANQIESAEEIVGTWKRGGSNNPATICRHSDDGILRCARTLEEIDKGEGFLEASYWFEDGRYHEQSDTADCQATGIYEIFLQENGNLKFELVEDDCSNRKAGWFGLGAAEGKIEWEPQP